jgi:chromosome segregation ATPase
MHTKSILLIPALALLALRSAIAQSDDPATSTETRLRDALRQTVGQLRDAQNQIVSLQAAQAQSDKDKADLQVKVDALTLQLKDATDKSAADKAASDKAMADLKAGEDNLVTGMVDTLTRQINNLDQPGIEDAPDIGKAIADFKSRNPELAPALDQYATDIQLWTTGYVQYVRLQKKTESQRAGLAAQVPVLRQLLADREAKNVALYKLGDDILTRYEKFGLGDALAAKEPFVGMSRVRLENLVQDYKDKLRDQIVIPGQPPAPVASAAPSGSLSQR